MTPKTARPLTRFPARPGLAALALMAATPLLQAAALPPPGQYRIDAESSTRSGAGPAATERIEQVDGATGRRQVTTQAGPPGTPPTRQTYPGQGPVTWCVKPPPRQAPAALPGRCDAGWLQQGADSATLRAQCQAGRLQEQWKQLDARTWERRMDFDAAPPAAAGDPGAALAFVQRGLSPAQAAQARADVAALPGPQATAAAMAPVYAQLEETIRSGPPQEAASARQQLAALKASQGAGGGTAARVRTRLTERWTRVADTCPGS